jgi:hypothetical protein|uniref:Uncharacterized protein n=1 Tax=Zea mays TaxID=4577 RepID=A0A804NJT3_MAIZE
MLKHLILQQHDHKICCTSSLSLATVYIYYRITKKTEQISRNQSFVYFSSILVADGRWLAGITRGVAVAIAAMGPMLMVVVAAMAAAAATPGGLSLGSIVTCSEPCGDGHVLQVVGRGQGDGRGNGDGPRRAGPLAELAGGLADAGHPAAAGAEVVHREGQRRGRVEQHLRGGVDELGQRLEDLALVRLAGRRQPRRQRL